MRLKGKIAVIAGAGCGFGMGRGIPIGFAREGANLVLNYYRQDGNCMEQLVRELKGYGAEVELVEGDISREDIAYKLIETAVERFEKIDILLNVTGISIPCKIQNMTLEVWKKLIDIDLTSVFLTCRYAVPYMIEQRYGRIINIASQLGQKGGVSHSHYSAAKAGVIGFTKSIARELAEYGINANCIAPGPINTQLLGTDSEEWKAEKATELVIKRFGEIDEVVPTAVFLASEPDGNLYTGQTLGPNLGDVML